MSAALPTSALAALARLLAYPTDDLRADLPPIEATLAADPVVRVRALGPLRGLIDELRGGDLYDLQERYVGLFDRTRRLSLNMFEHVHGESRDRGQAMIDLAELYERVGLEIAIHELPDYVPLFLEFLATRPLAEARGFVADAASVLSALESRLAERGSSYASVFAAARAIAGTPCEAAEPEPAGRDDLVALDAAWEEEAVFFGPAAASNDCAIDRLRMRVRAERRDANAPTSRGSTDVGSD